MEKRRSLFLLSTGGFTLILLAATLGSLSLLRSPTGSLWILGKVKTALRQKFDIKLDCQALMLDPFGHIHFEDLTLVQETDPLRLHLAIKQLDLAFGFSILNRSVTIEKLEILSPEIKVEAKNLTPQMVAQPTKSPPASAVTPAEIRAKLGGLEQVVSSPQIDFDLQNFVIKGLNIEVLQIARVLAQGAGGKTTPSESSLGLKIKDAMLTFALKWTKGGITSKGTFSLGASNPLEWQTSLFETDFGGKPVGKMNFVGKFRGDGNWDIALLHENKKWTDRSKATQLNLGLEAATFETSAKEGPPVKFDIGRADASASLHSLREVDFQILAGELNIPAAFVSPSSIQVNTKLEISEDFSHAQLKADAALNKISLLDLELTARHPSALTPQAPWLCDGKASLKAPQELAAQLVFGKNLLKVHPLEIQTGFQVSPPQGDNLNLNFELKVPHLQVKPYPFAHSIQHASRIQWNAKTNSLQTTGSTQIAKVSVSGSSEGLPVEIFDEPCTVEHSVSLNQDRAEVGVTARLPVIRVPSAVQIKDTLITSKVLIEDLKTPEQIQFDASLNQGEVQILESQAKKSQKQIPMTGMEAKIKLSVDSHHRLTMREMSADLNHSMAHLSAEAIGDSAAQNFQTQGVLAINIPNSLPEIAGQKLSGKFTCPWTFSVYDGKRIALDAKLQIADLNWSRAARGEIGKKNYSDPMSVSGVQGSIPVNEEFLWDGENIRFSHLITRNPFERVDFESVQPLINEAERLNIREIGVAEKSYGPFQGFFSLKQNMLFSHRFDFKLGSGHTFGELFMDVHPQNMQLGMLARLTNLNLTELLPKRLISTAPVGDQNLSGRSGVIVSLNHGTIDGRVDVTQIGRNQLLTLINVIDPKFENTKMNKARSALAVAYPTFIQMAFQEGMMDMNVKLSGFPIPELPLRGIPISNWITGATAQVVKSTRKGRLK